MTNKTPKNLSDLLDGVEDCLQSDSSGTGTDQKPTVGDALTAFGRRSHGPVLFLTGFLAAGPIGAIPGVTLATALLCLVVAGQMLLSPGAIWLPKRLTAIELTPEKGQAALRWARPVARTVDRLLKPRLSFLLDQPFLLGGILLAVGMSLLMIPFAFVPFAATVPALAIAAFGLALTSDDGLLALIAGAVAAGAVGLGVYLLNGL
ncbi:exopolysaccharide biosynthesis protein [Rhodospirillaceae bacterium KN72]|uniref:Exopolysaccharide biosynthesis protein n=1 Tax=Pacificispira spongiicola TaxID=2729598 RepID=A0A7Y0DYX0_9PROT|nr:exopolysaccharide biosynthesis protein [Pacificispira spongiicola]NMM44058.1 exopolysaccharide biosynthesis protein [Pacificispira spongiicola]